MNSKYEQNIYQCPFCGMKGRLVSGSEYIGNESKTIYQVVCQNPKCIICNGYTKYSNDYREAIKAWNKRINKNN